MGIHFGCTFILMGFCCGVLFHCFRLFTNFTVILFIYSSLFAIYVNVCLSELQAGASLSLHIAVAIVTMLGGPARQN